MSQQRFFLLDLLKGLAIFAVVLYHLGLFEYGYFGVEIFLVVSGFLTTKSVVGAYNRKGAFSYGHFLFKRIVRLFPLVVLLCTCAFVIAYFVQLPDNFKNTCETTIGTLTFTNNFVQYITSGNYWDTSNDFKPLMHTWYLAVLLQFYLLYPLAISLLCKMKVRLDRALNLIIIAGGVMSFLAYLLGCSSDAFKFFLLPCRYWEFALGAYVAIRPKHGVCDKKVYWALLSICLLICVNVNFASNAYRLVLTAMATALIIANIDAERSCCRLRLSALTLLGRASFSIYVWHQFIFAFYRYVVDATFNVLSYSVVLAVSLAIGLASYSLFEQKFTNWMTSNKMRSLSVVGLNALVAIALVMVGFRFYKQNGIVRDVPELGISKDNTSFQSQDYNSRNNVFDTDFPTNNKKNILVLGDSFARDWINVLRESGALTSYNISVYSLDDSVALARAKKADIIFMANNGPFNFHRAMPEIANHQYYRVGHKGFGKCNGNVYDRILLGLSGYDQTFRYDDSLNIDERKLFGKHFIDMMACIELSKGQYPYFTPNHKFFSHDGIHLTQAGAQRFAHLLNMRKWVVNNAAL